MGGAREPAPPEVIVHGGPASTAGAGPPAHRSVLGRAVLGLTAVALVASAVAQQRSAPEPAAPPCPQPCLAPDALVLGAALPLTGALAPFGVAQRRGVERALDEVDERGGLEVAGERKPVELLVRDTGSEPDVAGQAALILVRGPWELLGLVGPCAPPLAMVRVAESRQVPLVTGCQPLPLVGPGPRRHAFEVAPAEPERAAAVFRSLGPPPSRRVGLFLSNDRSAAPWASAGVEAGFDVHGTYRPRGRDWSSAVAQAAQDGVDVVVAVTQPPEGIGLWQELARQGVTPQTAYASEAGLGSAWHTAVGRSGDGTLTDLVHPLPRSAATPQEVDDAVTAVSAELTRVLLDGLRRARVADRTGLRAGLRSATARVAGTDVRFLDDRASRLPVRLARWEAGRLRPVLE